ncbi:MAG: sigma-70 family RNA polymerase sigma factor [Bacteroidota bacterium]
MSEAFDQEVVNRIAEGDEGAFRELFLLLYPKLTLAGLQVRRSPELVEEVVQDLLLWVWDHRRELTRIDNLENYLFRSVYQNTVRAVKREQRLRERRSAAPVGEPAAEPPSTVLEAGEEAAARQRVVAGALAQLSAQQRQVIHLRFYQDKAYREIAQMLGIKEQVARNVAYRGLQKLRKHAGSLRKALELLAWLCLVGDLLALFG